MVSTESASRSQRQRWESGRLRLIRDKVPVLLRRAVLDQPVCLDLAWSVDPASFVHRVDAVALLAVAVALFAHGSRTAGLTLLGVGSVDCAALVAYVGRGWALAVSADAASGTCCACLLILWKCCCWFPARDHDVDQNQA